MRAEEYWDAANEFEPDPEQDDPINAHDRDTDSDDEDNDEDEDGDEDDEAEWIPDPRQGLTGRRAGRPKKENRLDVEWGAIDRLIVHGEEYEPEEGKPGHRYPTYREIGDRFGITFTTVAKYAKTHNCIERRRRQRLINKAEEDTGTKQKRGKITAERILDIIDRAIYSFERGLMEDRIIINTVDDFVKLVRARQVLTGEADARTEVVHGVTLEALQQRYQHIAGKVEKEKLLAAKKEKEQDEQEDRDIIDAQFEDADSASGDKGDDGTKDECED